jgi:hypothetical protein
MSSTLDDFFGQPHLVLEADDIADGVITKAKLEESLQIEITSGITTADLASDTGTLVINGGYF